MRLIFHEKKQNYIHSKKLHGIQNSSSHLSIPFFRLLLHPRTQQDVDSIESLHASHSDKGMGTGEVNAATDI